MGASRAPLRGRQPLAVRRIYRGTALKRNRGGGGARNLDDGDGAAERARPAPRRVPPVHPLHLLFGFGVRMQGVGCEVQGVEWWQGRAGRCSEISGFGREFGGGGGHRKARAHLPGEEPRLPPPEQRLVGRARRVEGLVFVGCWLLLLVGVPGVGSRE